MKTKPVFAMVVGVTALSGIATAPDARSDVVVTCQVSCVLTCKDLPACSEGRFTLINNTTVSGLPEIWTSNSTNAVSSAYSGNSTSTSESVLENATFDFPDQYDDEKAAKNGCLREGQSQLADIKNEYEDYNPQPAFVNCDNNDITLQGPGYF